MKANYSDAFIEHAVINGARGVRGTLTMNQQLTPFGFTHLVTSVNQLKLAPTLASRWFTSLQLPGIGL